MSFRNGMYKDKAEKPLDLGKSTNQYMKSSNKQKLSNTNRYKMTPEHSFVYFLLCKPLHFTKLQRRKSKRVCTIQVPD